MNPIYSGKDDQSFSLYSINIRGRSHEIDPSLCIRKLSNNDNLFQVEHQNRNHQQLIWLKSELIRENPNLPPQIKNLYLSLFFEENPLPQYKYVFCSQAMINLIIDAFQNKEVSFSDEAYRQSIVNQ